MTGIYHVAAAVFVFWSSGCDAVADHATPVSKVIELLTALKSQVEGEGRDEALEYDDFACFCKTTTADKSSSITSGRDNIGTFSAEVADNTANVAGWTRDLQGRKADEEAWERALTEEETRCEKERVEYEARAADTTKAISSIEKAIQSMTDSKPSLLAVQKTVSGALHILAEPQRKDLSKLLQTHVDPSDPTYKYHSDGIIAILNDLLTKFRNKKSDEDIEYGKTEAACTKQISSLRQQLQTNSVAMTNLESNIDTGKGNIATARQNLLNEEASLKDDQLYLKDLTSLCEARANDWDQRSELRAGELTALSSAINVLQNEVDHRDQQVNNRSVLIQRHLSTPSTDGHNSVMLALRTAPIQKHVVTVPVLLQEGSIIAGSSHGNLRRSSLSNAERQIKAMKLLQQEGLRLQSRMLSMASMHVAADPFADVKGLIQKLIERLLSEARAEATKKTFCDENLGKLRQDRDFRYEEAGKLDNELKALELKQDELQAEIQLLSAALVKLRSDLETATNNRDAERVFNTNTISTAKEGLAKVREAILILKVFYKQAAKATVLVQQKASPVEADTSGPGFEGAYQGKQLESKGIFGLLAVIESDFDRTARTTEVLEKKAQEDFVEFDRVSKADISGKDTKKELDEQDLETTADTIATKMDDLQTAQGLLDDALKALEALKPTCIDTTMSYADRVARREEEKQALQRAWCILAPDDKKDTADWVCGGASM